MFRYDRLDELIEETGKKKNYLSEKMGHSGRYLNDAKKQGTNIKTEDVQILAIELKTSVEYLRGETDEKNPAPQKGDGIEDPVLREIMQRVDTMTPDQLRLTLEHVKMIESLRK